VSVNEFLQRFRAQQRNVTVSDYNGAFESFELVHRALNCVTSAVLFFLDGSLHDGSGQLLCNCINRWAYLIALVADDGDNEIRVHTCSGVKGVGQKAAAADGV
jgi:hypothetical protein